MIIQKPSSFVKLSQVNHMHLFVLIIARLGVFVVLMGVFLV
ncbi:hypothetical protein AO372_1925 [Moraxella catarrhalis]|nr:hypothetical protein AO372_1925 [Moraxella catarrhalis]OAV23949.1 hypothetical protein AO369_1897 [Moraxella catarrhalis]